MSFVRLLASALALFLLSASALAAFPTPVSLDNAPAPVRDPSIANRLPLTGYFVRSFQVNNQTRTAKIYIAAQAPIRSYFTVISVPAGVNTEDFLQASGWKALADQTQEGLFVLEPGASGWGSADDELPYVNAAMSFYAGSGNRYFSIFGENYLVGYGSGAPPLEAWGAANPLQVIGQVYLDSQGLASTYLDQFYTKTFDGTTAPGYSTVVFPPGFQLIKYAETVVPTWYINPNASAGTSLTYWKYANDCVESPTPDPVLGQVCEQASNSGRWMTAFSGPISKVAVLNSPLAYASPDTTREIHDFLTHYTRYENFFAYSNQLVIRADYAQLGIELHTMMVNGFNREYMVYVPDSARAKWGNAAPLMWVWPGNSQTTRVFLDATQWWKVAQDNGFVLVIIGERINTNAISVSHADALPFFKQLRDVIVQNYPVDPTRIYFTGQSAGSFLTQGFAVAFPEFIAAAASTSGTPSGFNGSRVSIDGTNYPASNRMIPDYMIYGAGDLGSLLGDLWDTNVNALDTWAQYMLGVNGYALTSADQGRVVVSGLHDRYYTWPWAKQFGGQTVPVFQLTKNVLRSHNHYYAEIPMLWEFARHYSVETDPNGNITRYFSPSGFEVPGDKVRIYALTDLPICSSPSDPALPQGVCTPPITASLVPSAINMRGGAVGVVSVVLRAASGYGLSGWTMSQVTLGGVAATSLALSADGSVVVAIFPKSAVGSASGNTMLSIEGMLERNGTRGLFATGVAARIIR